MAEPSENNPTPAQPAAATVATATPATPAAVPAPAAAAPAAAAPADQGQQETKVKIRLPYQRACNEKDAKGKLCAGHLKRWYGFGDDIKRRYGADAEIYRCENCHTLYLPAPGYGHRTGTLQF